MIRSLFAFLFFISIFSATISFAQLSPVDLFIADEIGKIGEVIRVNVKVNGFTDIIACQASINWDPSLLKYSGVSDFGIAFLGEDDFGTTTSDQGHLRFAWDPNDALPISVSDSTVLFSIQFEIITTQSQDISISFTDITSDPAFPNEFANSNYDLLTINTSPGVISAVADFKDLVNIRSIPDTSCDEKTPLGSLKADVMDDSTSYTFHWFHGNIVTATPDYIGYRYNNLLAGDYTLQVLDEDNALFVESISAVIVDASNYQSNAISIISNNPQTTCSILPEKQTGSIEINVNDAQPADTYLISWWEETLENGTELMDFRDLFKAEKLKGGAYEIAVKNMTDGCMSYLKENIEENKILIQLETTSTPNNYCEDGANGSATVAITNPENLDPRYYWFFENDAMDTTSARKKGPTFDQLNEGVYKAWVIDLLTECFSTENITVEKDEIYAEALIVQEGSALKANDERANWFRNDIFLQKTGLTLNPSLSGYYHITISNEFNCFSKSESLFYGITGLEAVDTDLSIFPNPFEEYIRISNQDGLLEFVQVYDTQGRLISENNSIKNKFIDLYLSGSSDGIYLIKMRRDGKIYTRKVVKNLSN